MMLPADSFESINSVHPADGASPSSIDPKWLLQIAVARWKLILVTLLIALLASYGVLQVVPRLYKSTAEILIFDPQRQVNQDIEKSFSPFHENVDAVAMTTEIAVIKSKSVAIRVAKKLGLDHDEKFLVRNPVSLWLEWLGLSEPEAGSKDLVTDAEQAALRLDRVAELVRAHVDADRISGTYIMVISATYRDPATSQRLAAAAASEFLSSQREAREQALQRVTMLLQSRLEALRVRIQDGETSIETLRSTSGLNDIAGKGKITDQQINDLNAQIVLARSDIAEKRTHLDKANRILQSKGDLQEIPEVRASTAINQLRLQASQLSWQEARLSSELGPNHAAVIAVHNQLLTVNRTISEESARVAGDLKSAYDIAVQHEQSLEANLQNLTGAQGTAEAFIKLQELQRAVDADRNIYQGLLSQYNDISTSGTVQGESARIISDPELGVLSSPKSLLYYGFGGTFGLGLGCLLAFLLENRRRGFKTGTEVVRAFGYPVLGLIPLMRPAKRGGNFEPTLLVQTMVDAPFSEFGEAVRTTRLSLQFSNPEQPRVILITSSIPGEGKSAAAMLLAASSAASGQRTVLVDCDLRRQSLSRSLGMPRRGLVDLLMGSADITEVTIKDPATGVYVIPAGGEGRASLNLADLLASQRMRELISKLREQYDYVALDASPVLPVADSLVLATMVDKVLMVVAWDSTSRDLVSEAFKILEPEARRVAGIVLNKVDPKRLPGYGYGYALH